MLPAFADSDRLVKFFMTNPTSTGCARAKAGISAVLQLKTALHASAHHGALSSPQVLQLKTALHAAPRLAAALTSSGEAPPTNEVRCRTESRTDLGCTSTCPALPASTSPPYLPYPLPALPYLPPSPQLLRAIVGNLASDEIDELSMRIHAVIDDEAIFRKQTSQRMLECLFAVRSKVSLPLMAADCH